MISIRRITKVCDGCNKDLPIGDFPRSAKSPSGYNRKCKNCRRVGFNRYRIRSNTHIYLMQADNGSIKIGLANDVQERLSTVRTCSPLSVRLLAYSYSADAGRIEQELHIQYKEFHLHGEWFAVPSERVVELVERVEGIHEEQAIAPNGHHWKING